MAAGFPMLRLALLVAIPYTFAPRAVFQNNSTCYGNSNDGSISLAAVGAAAAFEVEQIALKKRARENSVSLQDSSQR